MVKQEEVFQKFVEDIATAQQLNARSEDIEEAKRWIYKGGQAPLGEKIKSSVPEGFRILIAELEGSSRLPNSRKELGEFFKGLIEYIDKIPSVKLNLAFFPGEEFLNKLTDWLENQLGKKAVVDVSVDERIIAGAMIEYAGEYRDYSFASKLDEVLKKEVGSL